MSHVVRYKVIYEITEFIMDEKTYPHIISERGFTEWIPSCPMQVKKIRVEEKSSDSDVSVTVITCVCGDFGIESYTADIELLDERKQPIGVMRDVTLSPGESDSIVCDQTKTVFASAKITSVRYKSGDIWQNSGNISGKRIPEQEIYWQTDPLYDAVRLVCDGIVPVKYKPDEIDGAWRCACGQINLIGAKKCGGCGCEKEWLDTHLDPQYLAAQKKVADEKGEREIKKQTKKSSGGMSDKVKAILILASIVAVIVLLISTFTLIIPSVRYSSAEKLVESGEFDEAIAIFKDLGDFRDSSQKASETNYKKAQSITGLETVNIAYSETSKWFSITEDGVLSFVKSRYEDNGGTWGHFVVPDIVDDIVVRELDKNFMINCKELEEVTISDCVEVIGEQAFYNCGMLHTINFGKNVKEIKQRAFINCTGLQSIEIPDTVESLGIRAFNNCVNLNHVKLGKGITSIGDYYFSMCFELERITLNSPVTSIGEYAFSECTSLERINCNFSESEWTEPEIAEGNEIFDDVIITFE